MKKRPARGQKGSGQAPATPMPQNPRLVAALALAATLKGADSDSAFDGLCREAGLNDTQRAFAFAVFSTTLRNLGHMELLLSTLLDRPLPASRARVKALLLTGLAQLLCMRTADHAAVAETVEATKKLGRGDAALAALVNAVLRRAQREEIRCRTLMDENPLELVPPWLATRWQNRFGRKTAEAIAQAGKSSPPLDITPASAADATVLAEALSATPLPTGSLRRMMHPPEDLPGYQQGRWWVQDAAAAIPAKLLASKPGKCVVDLCAAPGGKTLQLAASGAQVVAVDHAAKRIEILRSNLERCGLNADCVAADVARWQPATPPKKILLDAPCSASGTFRHNPDVLWRKTEADIASLAAVQKRLLDAALAMLEAGGVLVYCTCSLEEEEGPAQIEAALKRHPGVTLDLIRPDEVGDPALIREGMLVTHPALWQDRGGMDGFFAARLMKTG